MHLEERDSGNEERRKIEQFQIKFYNPEATIRKAVDSEKAHSHHPAPVFVFLQLLSENLSKHSQKIGRQALGAHALNAITQGIQFHHKSGGIILILDTLHVANCCCMGVRMKGRERERERERDRQRE